MAKRTASELKVSNDLARFINELILKSDARQLMSTQLPAGIPPLEQSMRQIQACVDRITKRVKDALITEASRGWGVLSPLQKRTKAAAIHRLVGDRATRKCARAFRALKPQSKMRI